MNNKIHYKFNTNELHCKEAMQKIWNITLKFKKKWKMMKEFDITNVMNLNGDNAWTSGPSWKSREKKKVAYSSKSLKIRTNVPLICF
jgi:hypothetical protein